MKANVEFEISPERIAAGIEDEIVRMYCDEYYAKVETRRAVQTGVKSGIDAAVRKYIYENKDYIIERVVDRAAKYAAKKMVREDLPKLLERTDNDED